MNDGKNGSAAMTSGLRPITSPHANARPTLSARARTLGDQPRASAASRKRRRVSGATPGRSLSERSEEHTSELQSLMRSSYAAFCVKKKTTRKESQNKLQETK